MQSNDKIIKKIWKECVSGVVFVQLAFLISIIFFCKMFDLFSMEQMSIMNIVLNCVTLIMNIFMYWSCLQAGKLDRISTAFLLVLVVNSVYNYLDAAILLVSGHSEYAGFCYTLNLLYYLCPIAMSYVFWLFLLAFTAPNAVRKVKPWSIAVIVLTIIAVLMVFGNIFGDYYFTVNSNGVYVKNLDTYYISMIIPTIIFILCTVFIILQKTTLNNKIILISYTLLPYICSYFMQKKFNYTFNPIFSFVSVFYIYSNLYILRERQLAQKHRELAESKINSLLLQINPHFIYNTLGSVSSMCYDEPEKARDLLVKFSSYLRNNFSEMANKTLIPISEEISHLKNYVEIEKERFPDVNFNIEIKSTDFMIPSLSIQPLVENAISHGLMGREEGGSVSVLTYQDTRYYYVEVEDDGVGFDKIEKNDGKNHIGIQNVESRLQMLCEGELFVKSKVNVGTTSLIRIPIK